MLSVRGKVCLCLAIFLTTLVAISGIYLMSHTEYYFSQPSIQESIKDIPVFSNWYFHCYRLIWLVVVVVAVWSVALIVQKNCSLEAVALLAAYALLATTFCAVSAALAIYLCNQTLVLNMQHLR